MQLFYTKSSPYANCVRMVISELEIGDKIKMVESHPFNDDPQLLQISPLGKVPALEAAGETIYDSEVICDYLDASFSGGILFNPVYADWRLKSLLSVIAGLTDVLVARRIEAARASDKLKSEFWWKRQTAAVERTLEYITIKLSLFPEELTILHIQMMSNLKYLDFRHPDIPWRDDYPELGAFFESWRQRESIRANELID